MANMFNRQRNKPLHLASDIVFEGALLSDTRATLVTELISYILYERQQIPLTADQLRLRTDVSQEDKSGIEINFKKHQVQKVADRKAKLFLDDFKQICDHLKRSFRSCPEIDQVSILLGGTVVSPKESYVIKLPPTCPDADCLPLAACKNTLFKQIISEDILGSLKTALSPSNIMVLLSAPRSCPLSWFLPKHSISPKAATIISFNFHCVYFVPIRHNLSISDCDSVNLSGFEALECALCDADKRQSFDCCVLNGCAVDPVEEEDVEFHCKRKSCDRVLETPVNTDQVSAKVVPNEKIDRFCEHKRLNYVFSAHKNGKRPVVHSPRGTRLPQSISIPFPTIGSSSGGSSPSIEEVKDNCIDMNNAHEDECNTDSIWYQSPIVLKGFKDQVDHDLKLKFT